MRISFDLDGTLFVSDPSRALPDFLNYVEPYKVARVRRGTPELLRSLAERGWEIVFYTNSLRSRISLLAWARRLNFPVMDVINQQLHENACAERGVLPGQVAAKMPPWFGIGLHVDDSEDLAKAGKEFGFAVCVIDPDDAEWCAKVLARADEAVRD
jgi:FMN phosphatase YigB (HAD superfamily)